MESNTMWERVHTVGHQFGLGTAERPLPPEGSFDSDWVPPRDRFEYYRTTMQSLYIRATPERPSESANDAFRVRTRNGAIRDALFVHYAGTAHRVERRAADIARAATNCYFLLRQIGPHPLDLTTRTGDVQLWSRSLLIGDADVPFTGHANSDYRYALWLLPKRLVDPWLRRDRAGLAGGVVVGDDGAHALLDAWLDTLEDGTALFGGETGEEAISALGRLAALAAGQADVNEPMADAARAARRAQVLACIDRRFADPELTAGTVAAQLRVSPRSVHLVLEPTGLTFSQHVASRRLAAAHAALADGPFRSIADVAFGCGFNDLSTFHRLFRRGFGMTPGDVRKERPLDEH